jgi:hypothetical protein
MTVPWQSTPSPEIPGLAGTVLTRRIQDHGEVLRVVDADNLHARIAPEASGREGDRGQVRLQVARQQVDDQPRISPWYTAASFATMTP